MDFGGNIYSVDLPKIWVLGWQEVNSKTDLIMVGFTFLLSEYYRNL